MFGFCNVRHWNSDENSDNYVIRQSIVDYLKLDLIRIAESHLKGEEKLEVPGYEWLEHNHVELHRNARTGSGGVGLPIKDYLYDVFDIQKVDESVEGIMWVQFTAKECDFLCVYVIYHQLIHHEM